MVATAQWVELGDEVRWRRARPPRWPDAISRPRLGLSTAGIPSKDGAFIAFHGSWNRVPLPQGGYNVVFQPLADGKSSGPFAGFADGFAGAIKQPGQAAHRPTGLAVGSDGALYIADDQGGRI